MAINLEFINFIVPIEMIRRKYPGGWEQCIKDHNGLIGGRVWYDDDLFRDGAMNSMDIGLLVEEWRALGFNSHKGGKFPVKWDEVCVVEAMLGGTTLPCDWLEVDGDIAWLKNESGSPVIGRENMVQKNI